MQDVIFGTAWNNTYLLDFQRLYHVCRFVVRKGTYQHKRLHKVLLSAYLVEQEDNNYVKSFGRLPNVTMKILLVTIKV